MKEEGKVGGKVKPHLKIAHRMKKDLYTDTITAYTHGKEVATAAATAY